MAEGPHIPPEAIPEPVVDGTLRVVAERRGPGPHLQQAISAELRDRNARLGVRKMLSAALEACPVLGLTEGEVERALEWAEEYQDDPLMAKLKAALMVLRGSEGTG